MLEYRCVLILLSATDGFVDNHRGTESFFADRLGAFSCCG